MIPRRRPAAAALVLTLATLLSACSASVSVGSDPHVRKADLEESVASRITVDGRTADNIDVVCDDDLPGEDGATVDCVGTDREGASTGIRATVTEVDGTDISYDTTLFLLGEDVAAQVTSGLEDQGYPVASMECEEALGEVGTTSGCTGDVEGAGPVELVVTVKEIQGLRFRIGYETVD